LSFIPMPTGILQALAYVGVIAVLLAGAWVLTRVISRRLLRSLGRRPATDPDLMALLRQAGFYREALEILSHAGAPTPAATPPLRHAAALDPAVAADFAALGRLFYQVRFGRHPRSPEESDHAEELLVRLRAALH